MSPLVPLATSQRLAHSNHRRVKLVGGFALMVAALRLVGAPVPDGVLPVLGAWLALSLAFVPLFARSRMDGRAMDLATAATVGDLLFVGLIHPHIGGAWWMGITFYAFIVVSVNATLPSPRAAVLTAVALASSSALLLAEAAGIVPVASFLGSPPVEGNWRLAGLTAVVGGFTLTLLAALQQVLVRRSRQSQERDQLVRDTSPDMIMTFDGEGRFLTVNQATLDQSGYASEELIGQPFVPFIAPEDVDLVTAQFAAAFRGEPARYELRYVRKNGERRWLSATNTPMRSDGEIGGVLSICRDVTDQKLAAEALRSSEARYRAIVDTAFEGIWALDAEGRTDYANRRMGEMLGYAPEELLGRPVDEFLDDEARALVKRELACRRLGHRGLYELRFRRRDGTPMWTMISSTPRVDAEGRYAGAFAMISDLTERKQAERERERLHAELADAERLRAVGQLVSGVAHELNNPLASILGFAEILLQDSRSPEDEEGLRIIQEQGLRARSIVRDLLQFVRRSETRTIERVELPALLERVARLQRLQVDQLGVRLETAADDGLHACDVDVVGMEQVLANLVLNGAQAAGKGGVVRVLARRGAASGTCELVVEDDGPGIAANVMPRIFEPFFTTKPHGQGTGLGLSVSLGIVEQHGGTIRAENRTDGRGARFVVSLPFSDEVAPATREPREAEPHAGAQRGATSFPEQEPALVGLIVEDEPTIRAAMRRYFERRGWVLHEAKDGFGALTYLLGADANQRIDVVICDLKMPGMSGIDLHELLAATRPALLDRLLFSTGDTASPEAAAFLATTRCPVLEKPFELDVLGETIERLRAATAR